MRSTWISTVREETFINVIFFRGSTGVMGGPKMLKAPEIHSSTIEERRAYIKSRFPCIADCDMCGLCIVFRGKDAEQAYDDYIMGKRPFLDVSEDYKR